MDQIPGNNSDETVRKAAIKNRRGKLTFISIRSIGKT
jgi:hypothetical protein